MPFGARAHGKLQFGNVAETIGPCADDVCIWYGHRIGQIAHPGIERTAPILTSAIACGRMVVRYVLLTPTSQPITAPTQQHSPAGVLSVRRSCASAKPC